MYVHNKPNELSFIDNIENIHKENCNNGLYVCTIVNIDTNFNERTWKKANKKWLQFKITEGNNHIWKD
jgi:hypothetical protein